MRTNKPPDRFGLPPNYRWIHGHPPDPPISIGVQYTLSGHTVTVTQDRLSGARMCPDPNTKQ